MGFLSVPAFNINGSGSSDSLKLTLRPDGHSYQFSIKGSESNSYYHTNNGFSFGLDSVEGVGMYVLDTLKPTHGWVSAFQYSGFGTRNWNSRGAKLIRSGTDCIEVGWLQTNHILTISQWGPVGSVIKGKVSGELFAFPSSCANWEGMEYECNFALTREN